MHGVAMGSPLGPALAYAVLLHYEKEWLDSCPIELKPKLYKRYVDDIFVMFPSRDHVILATFEIKAQNSFLFLDIKIIRNTEKKGFEILDYRKNTFSGFFTNFKSFIPITYKIGVLETMLFRCFSICSSSEKFDHIFHTGHDTNYDDPSLNRYVKSILLSFFHNYL